MTISMEDSRRDLFIDMAVDMFICKNNQAPFILYKKKVWDYLKRVSFYCASVATCYVT